VGAFVLDARYGLNRGFDGPTIATAKNLAMRPKVERRAEDVIRPATAWIINPQSNP
jgi:hypothetical protein